MTALFWEIGEGTAPIGEPTGDAVQSGLGAETNVHRHHHGHWNGDRDRPARGHAG